MMDQKFHLDEQISKIYEFSNTYREYIYFLFLISFGIYEKYIKYRCKIHSLSCDCTADNVFEQMANYREFEPTPCDAGEKCIAKALFHLVGVINEASESIHITMPKFTQPQLIECVLHAYKRLVDIRIILRNSDGLENCTQLKKLLDAGEKLNCISKYSIE